MYTAIYNPSPTAVSLSSQTGSVLVKVGRRDGEVHMRFGSPGVASQFFLDAAVMLAETFKQLDEEREHGEKVR